MTNEQKIDLTEWLEEQVRINERRIKKIEMNPAPPKLSSNKIYYELQRDLRKSQIESWLEGKPTTVYGGAGLNDLFRSMGFELFDPEWITERVPTSMLKDCRKAYLGPGYSEMQCDLTTYPVGWAEMGIFPPQTIIVRGNGSCQPVGDANLAIAKLLGVPYYNITVPLWPKKPESLSDEAIDYMTDQLRNLIEWIEKTVPGTKFSEDKLEEWLNAGSRWITYLNRVWEAKKHKPCPMTARDGFREETPPYMYPEHLREKVVEWGRQWAEEVEERAATGQGCANEKVRVLWTVSGPLFDADLFPLLEGRGVTMPCYLPGAVPIHYAISEQFDLRNPYTPSGRKLSPLQKLARYASCVVWSSYAERWIDSIIVCARQQDVDGIVYFQNRGCPQVSGIVGLAAREIREELGIPFFSFKGPMFDESSYDQADFFSNLNQFLDVVEDYRKSKENQKG